MAIIMAGIVIVSSQTFRFIRRSTPPSGPSNSSPDRHTHVVMSLLDAPFCPPPSSGPRNSFLHTHAHVVMPLLDPPFPLPPPPPLPPLPRPYPPGPPPRLQFFL